MRLALLIALALVIPAPADDLGLKVPPGFRVTLWGDHTLANDIFTMALDEKGRVVVSGPGYVRRLEDTHGDGKADRTTDLIPTRTGAMGLLFAPDPPRREKCDLFTAKDGRLLQYHSHLESDGFPDELVLQRSFPFSEHGGHALKVGPGGAIYSILGNDGKLEALDRVDNSPVRKPEAGGVIRLVGPSHKQVDVIAHGFRNPYDFDFTPYGDIITFDSDTERDFLLPWYIPTRVYHVLHGAHHGWRLTGYTRSLGRPDYYPDTVEMLADMGRGSPTGVCCYRHTQFPEHYRGGVFLLDWTFGKVYYMPLIPAGSSYRKVKPEVFLEPTGTNGFAPTAARVAPDGSLLISIGGRGTRGAVYKVEYVGEGIKPRAPIEPAADIDRVLDAPQPLEAWSIAKWRPLADKIDAEKFAAIAYDEKETNERRIRAIDIVADRPGGVRHELISRLATAKYPLVRARVTSMAELEIGWFSGRRISVERTEDTDPRVVVAALTALADHLPPEYRMESGLVAPSGNVSELEPIVGCMGHEDRRVRLAAARVVVALGPEARAALAKLVDRSKTSRTLTTMIVAETWPGQTSKSTFSELWPSASKAWDLAGTTSERADALRAMQLAFGDLNLEAPPCELLSAYSLPERSKADGAYFRLASRETFARMRRRFPSDNPHEDIEASRLFAMLAADDPELVRKVQSQITDKSHPTNDFHYLTVLCRLTAPRDESQSKQVADALLGMEKKLAGRQLRIKQNWSARLGELVAELLRVYPKLGQVIGGHPALMQPGHVVIAGKLTGAPRREAAQRFLTAIRTDEELPLSTELIDLLAGLPPAEVRPVLRARWSERAMRESIVRQLADRPDAVDRSKFLDVLETAGPDVAHLAVSALEALPRDPSPANLVPLLGRLRQSFVEPKEGRLRKEIVDLVNHQVGQGLVILESKTDTASLAAAYGPVFEWFERAYPAEAMRLNAAGEDEAAIRAMLPAVQWDVGDVERGRKLFRDRGCQVCHGGSAQIGPDLAGVTRRMSRDDLFTAIVNPSRDVAPVYRVTKVDLKDGKRISGIVVFESADGLIVQTGAAETRRIANEDIDSRTPSPKSLMPDGLLKGIKTEELADLFAFLGKQ